MSGHGWHVPQGYFAPSCLEKLLTAVRAITSRGIWVVVAAKARYAAGEDTKPDASPTPWRAPSEFGTPLAPHR